MLGTRKALWRCWLLAGSTWVLGSSSCSGAAFTSNGAEGGTNGNAGSNATSGGEAGSSANAGSDSAGDSSAGAPDRGGSAGAGGTGSGACECPSGKYCREGTLDCFYCSELNRLNFTTPERLATVSDSGQGAHFPRLGATGADLLYQVEGVGLRYTADSSTSPGANVKGTDATDSGPLLLAAKVPNVGATMMSFNFLFDRTVEGRRSIYVGEWNNGLTSSMPAPAPYNETKNDYSIAVALKPTADGVPRAFWMTDRDTPTTIMGGPRLVTAPAVADAPAAPVGLELGQKGCAASDADLAPWVTSDGKTLLVSHTRVDATCKATGQRKDIYIALLQPATGLPTAPALPMNDINSSSNEVEPSFSTDLCDLYFASDRDGKYALYRAHRR